MPADLSPLFFPHHPFGLTFPSHALLLYECVSSRVASHIGDMCAQVPPPPKQKQKTGELKLQKERIPISFYKGMLGATGL